MANAEKRSYSEEQIAGALTRYADSGCAAASVMTGIPAGTIASWAHRRNVQRFAPERTSAAIDALQLGASVRWAEHKAELVGKLGGFADAALEAAYDRLEDGDLRSAKEGMLAVAIAIDKAQLLTGGATGRHDGEVTHVVRQELLGDGRARVMELMPPSRAKTGTEP